jgi:RNA polymerase primary sigma factor
MQEYKNTYRQQYSKIVKENPILTRKEEIRLSREAKKGSEYARNKLIQSNYRLVMSIAKRYHRKDMDFDDLLQESSIGLIKAVDKFDPELGYKFSTYATWWIKQAALQYLNESASDIKVPTHSRLLYQKIRKKMAELEEQSGKSPTIKEVAVALEEPVKKIKYTMKANDKISSLDNENEETGSTLLNKVSDNDDYVNPETLMLNKELKSVIRKSLSLLTAKEEKILRLRFGITEDITDTENFPVTNEMKEYLND